MKPFLIISCLCTLFRLNAQSIPDSTEEDQILQRIEIGDRVTPAYFLLEQAAFTPKEELQLRDCSWYRNDSVFNGVIKKTISDSSYELATCRKGQPTGERLVYEKEAATGRYFPSYYARPDLGDSTILAVERYNTAGVITERSCTHLDYCPAFEAFFGSNGPNCRCYFYYDDGTLKAQYTSYSGSYDGEFRWMYANGRLREQRFYSKGTPVGKWTQYAVNGKRTGKVVFSKKPGKKPRGHWVWDNELPH